MHRFLALSLVALIACDTEAPLQDHTGEAAAADTFRYEVTDDTFVGVLDDGVYLVDFSSTWLGDDILDMTIETNDMLVSFTLDVENGVIEYDGFGTQTGADTAMRDADRAAMKALVQAIMASGEDAEHVMKLHDFASGWAGFPETLSLQGQVLAQKDRSYQSLCIACGGYFQATHDGWGHSNWEDGDTYFVGLSTDGSQCNKDDETKYRDSGSSTFNDCTEPDHSTSKEYAFGLCFGNCGEGCDGTPDMTTDCADHDSCVRFGHDVASMWCNDEFLSTVDDFAAAPICGSACNAKGENYWKPGGGYNGHWYR